jgi:hypothetical protein
MIYQFYAELLESAPLVWRRIVVPADYTFYQLIRQFRGHLAGRIATFFNFPNQGFPTKLFMACLGMISILIW